MANLFKDTDLSSFTDILEDHFDTFKRQITVYKEPKKVITSGPFDSVLAGYDETSDTKDISYVTVSSTFDALINYQNKQDLPYMTEITSIISKGIVKIKVKGEARDYIRQGKTERIVIDSNSFNVISDDKLQNFLGLNYYIFFLERTD